jgi:hypothetical protein
MDSYIAAVYALMTFSGADGIDYDVAKTKSDDALQKWASAKVALELHLTEHQCDPAPFAASA